MASNHPPKDRSAKDKSAAVPTPADPDLFIFLESLFEDDWADQVYVRHLYGPNKKNMGTQVDTYSVKPNMPKPQREDLLKLCNRFRMLAQKHCDMTGKPQAYAVLPVNTSKLDRSYRNYSFSMKPGEGGLFDGGTDGGGEEDDDNSGGGEFGKDKLTRRTNMLLTDHRWMVDQYQKTNAAMHARYEHIIDKQLSHNEALQDKLSTMHAVVETSMQKNHEREQDRLWQQFKFEKLNELLVLLQGAVPHVISRINGKQLQPDAVVLANFLKSIEKDEELLHKLFSAGDENGNVTRKGVLTVAQTYLINAVAHGDEPVESLDHLLPNAKCMITTAQAAEIEDLVGGPRLIPLMMLIGNLIKKKAAKNEVASSAMIVEGTATTETK